MKKIEFVCKDHPDVVLPHTVWCEDPIQVAIEPCPCCTEDEAFNPEEEILRILKGEYDA